LKRVSPPAGGDEAVRLDCTRFLEKAGQKLSRFLKKAWQKLSGMERGKGDVKAFKNEGNIKLLKRSCRAVNHWLRFGCGDFVALLVVNQRLQSALREAF
jgi:hypothetical protein